MLTRNAANSWVFDADIGTVVCQEISRCLTLLSLGIGPLNVCWSWIFAV